MEPADRRRGFRRILAAGLLGICLGALAFIGDGLRGVVAAAFLGVVSSASTWLLATTLCGYRAASWRIAAAAGALFGVGRPPRTTCCAGSPSGRGRWAGSAN